MMSLVAKLKSESDISFGKPVHEDKAKNEDYDAYEKRIWQQRAHTSNGNVVIPPAMFHGSLIEAARYTGMNIKGKGKATYTKHFMGGVMITEPINTGLTLEDLEPQWVYVPSDGKRGGSTRVFRCFPLLHEWEGDLEVSVLDDQITMDIFKFHLEAAGLYIGIGTFRPAKGGHHGRFSVVSIKNK